ncbi:hypothetical protein JCM17823_07060 [Halorubrum gandharaense]
MSLRPVDTDTLGEISIEVAKENFGFLYVDRVANEIRERYESSDTPLMKAGNLSRSDVKEALQNIASEDWENIERIRSGVFYYAVFSTGPPERVLNRLRDLFMSTQQVVTAEQLREEFNLAIEDTEFFAEKLVSNGLLSRIATGSREYYSVGPKLKEKTGQNQLKDELIKQSRNGTPVGVLSHEELEQIISVNATSDVIHYLEGQLGLLSDLDGEYLVWGSIEQYGEWMAEEIAEDVADEFESTGYAMPKQEYREVVRARIEARSSILKQLSRQKRTEAVDAVQEGLTTIAEIHINGPVAVHEAPLEDEIAAHAEKIVDPILADGSGAAMATLKQEAKEEVADLHLADDEKANKHLRSRVQDRTETLIEEEGF